MQFGRFSRITNHKSQITFHGSRPSIAIEKLSSKRDGLNQVKAKHHFWSSLAAGGALYWATGSSAALAGTILGGFLIDADHIIDQLWSIRHGAPLRRPV